MGFYKNPRVRRFNMFQHPELSRYTRSGSVRVMVAHVYGLLPNSNTALTLRVAR